MKKILVDQKVFEFTKKNLPILIHGEDKSGASLYTITLIANLFAKGFKLVVLCGYHMAQEEFTRQVGEFHDDVIFYTKEKELEFLIENLNDIDNQIILIKNVELFNKDTTVSVLKNRNIIISGDINKCACKDEILKKAFTTKIFFSKLVGIETPDLNKYEGSFVSDNLQAITTIKTT